jgi:hypothetical protein
VPEINGFTQSNLLLSSMPSTWDEILYAEIQQITDQSLPTFRNEAQRILGEHVKIGNIHSPGVFQKIIDHFREMLAAIRNRMLSVVEETKYDSNVSGSELAAELPKEISGAFDSCVNAANSQLAAHAPTYPSFSEEQRTIKADEFREILQEKVQSLLVYKNRTIGF